MPPIQSRTRGYGEFLAFMGQFDQGLAELRLAQSLDPVSLIIATDVGKVLMLARRHDEAIAQLRKVLELDATYTMARVWLWYSLSYSGRWEQALVEMPPVEPTEPLSAALGRAQIYGRSGQRDRAWREIQFASSLRTKHYSSPFWFAQSYAAVGDLDRAFAELERVCEERAVGVITFKVDPAFDALRHDPRFDRLLARAGFAPVKTLASQ